MPHCVLFWEHVIQKGSLVDANRLRFDFAHYSVIDADRKIEDLVNTQLIGPYQHRLHY